MIKKLTFFDNYKDLEELTGLTHEELWDKGFNLDDMDFGFVSDEAFDHLEKEEYTYTDYETHEDKVEYWERRFPNIEKYYPGYFLLSRMEDYCVGYHYVEYNGKHYYTLHHA